VGLSAEPYDIQFSVVGSGSELQDLVGVDNDVVPCAAGEDDRRFARGWFVGGSRHLEVIGMGAYTPCWLFIMESDKLPSHFLNHAVVPAQSNRRRRIPFLLLGILLFIGIQAVLTFHSQNPRTSTIPIHAPKTLQKCRHLHTKPSPPPDFNLRKQSDRYVPGTRATLLRNATIWTGGIKGFEIVEGDLLLDRGLIKAVGRVDARALEVYKTDLVVIDLEGAWVTPGYAFDFS